MRKAAHVSQRKMTLGASRVRLGAAADMLEEVHHGNL